MSKVTLVGWVLCWAYILFGNTVLAQESVDKDTINGEVVYVYPFTTPVTAHSAYYIVAKKLRSKGPRYTFRMYYMEMYGEDYDKKAYRIARREIRRAIFSRRLYNSENRDINRKFKKAARLNPYPLIQTKYVMDQDVTPSLDPIPDGRYVQYFAPFYMMNSKGKRSLEEKRVSGIFTIRNNALDGEAVWLSYGGDTLKKGFFKDGAKVGEWYLETRKVPSAMNKTNVEKYIERGYPDIDTTREFVTYSGGYRNGPYSTYQNSAYPTMEGNFKDNEPYGTWTERTVGYIGKGKNRKLNRDNRIITWTYTLADEETVIRQPIIRTKLVRDVNYDSDFNFDPRYEPSIHFGKMFTLNYPKSPDLDLDEEDLNSYEGEVYDEEMYMEGMEYYEGEEYYGEEEYYGDEGNEYGSYTYDAESGRYISVAKLRDSLGIICNYKGVYEKRYPNGQLMVRYEFENGKLKEEDTIFWDNGKAYDVIRFDQDSNQYIQSIYDYTGRLFNEIIFDSIGEFVRVSYQPETTRNFNIGGLVVEDRPNAKYFFYDRLDSIEYVTTDRQVVFTSWYKEDTSRLYTRWYDPKERTVSYEMYGATGKVSLNAEMIFNENFENWTGNSSYRLGDLELKRVSSASFAEYEVKDSVPVRHVNEFDRYFEVTDDEVLWSQGKPYTGEIKITSNTRKFSLKSGKSVDLCLPRSMEMTNGLQKDLTRFRSGGKARNELLMNTIDASEFDEDFGRGIFMFLFGGSLANFIDYPSSGFYEYEMEEAPRYREKKERPFPKTIEGYMLDGKPHGTWKVYDQFGKPYTVIPFEKGEVHGTVLEYDVELPGSRSLNFEYESPALSDSFPKKNTHYLYSTSEFRNGRRNGKSITYTWYGEVTSETNYKDGYKEGPAMERNKLAYTSLNYANGALDGYVKTYLTLQGQDSMLLFDLNFQDGLLQGESKSFHTNGKLAKRGFFLNGESIDDYEAFDTLGFRYHYVKFLYAFPVEEKIWEENELSVRYQFDWRDSIYFEPTDITSTQSLDRILARLGIGRDYYQQPYYGRPSIVNKTGIDYHMTKYYPNDTIARDGSISSGKKVGCWKFYSYEGEMLYEVDYFDTIISINDSVQFRSKGILTDYSSDGRKLSESWIIEKFEKYDCSHTDHYEIRQLMTIWEAHDSLGRMNGYVKNYYDNGVLQNEGIMKDGLPTGIWKFYDPYGKLNQVGNYVLGKRDGRWLAGDLSKTKYLGDICLNPNLPNLEEEIKYREKLLDIVITNYKMGKALNKEFYDVNMNEFEEEEEVEEGE